MPRGLAELGVEPEGGVSWGLGQGRQRHPPWPGPLGPTCRKAAQADSSQSWGGREGGGCLPRAGWAAPGCLAFQEGLGGPSLGWVYGFLPWAGVGLADLLRSHPLGGLEDSPERRRIPVGLWGGQAGEEGSVVLSHGCCSSSVWVVSHGEDKVGPGQDGQLSVWETQNPRWGLVERRKGAPPSPCEVWLRAPVAFRPRWGKKSWAFLVPTGWVTFRVRSILPHPALSQLALRSALAGRTQCQPPWSSGREEIPQEALHVRLGPPRCPEPCQSLPSP